MLTKQQIETLRRSRANTRNRLARAMELADLTQAQLAQAMGFTQSFISKVKNGQYIDLPGETMRKFAGHFGCAIEDLFPAREAIAS